ncbi:hypothetical protein BE221DRAFT_192190 [Ostreococcus tauri]|uniref:Uncharacterized protein n=1 Tax=Ostreococcus tauri TaxID=70448 RepID=A0A1Y5IDA2_OSTTA|nr:hypothetical protein BE221DRAFT_192190 [Ostreococcus tauri]
MDVRRDRVGVSRSFADAFAAHETYEASMTSSRKLCAFVRDAATARVRTLGRGDADADAIVKDGAREGGGASCASTSTSESMDGDAGAETVRRGAAAFAEDPVDALMRAANASDSDSEELNQRGASVEVVELGRGAIGGTRETEEDVNERWRAKKKQTHQRHSGRGTIQVSMAFEIISTKAKGEAGVEARLAELENTTSGLNAQTHRISQQEYVTRLKRLNEDIANAWLNDDRVNALKLCVKVSRLLADTKVGKFYPVLFVLVTEVIETVGRLVFDRITRKAEEPGPNGASKPLPDNFKASHVRALAKNTCRNWFYKISTIRDLVPRMYMELALFKCYRFLQDEPPVMQARRLLQQARGIADPLAAAYIRMYIAKCVLACDCETPESERTMEILKEFMPSYTKVLDEDAEDDPSTSYIFALGMRRAEYAELMDPAMEWLIESCAQNSNPALLQKVLYMGGEKPAVPFLRSVFRSLSKILIRENAVKFISLISATSTDEDSIDHVGAMADCYCVLVDKFEETPPREDDRLAILSEVWRAVQKWTHIEPYLRVAERFLHYIIKYLTKGELETLMKDVARHVHAWLEKAREKEPMKSPTLSAPAMRYVARSLQTTTDYFKGVTALLNLKWYVYLGETLRGDAKVEYSASVLNCAASGSKVTDPLCLHTLLEAARTVHDNVDGMSSDDVREEAELLVLRFIDSVDFGDDFEAHLNFLVVARSAFSNLDQVQELLVYRALLLVTGVYEHVGSAHTSKTKAFVNACTAYCQITIPSVRGVEVRLRLFTLAARAALVHALVQQADGLIRSAVTDAQESGGESAVGGWIDLPTEKSEQEMLDFVRRCGSLLIVAPGNLEQGAFLVFRGLMKVIEDFEWQPSSVSEIRSYIALIPAIAAMVQEKLPYKLDGVQSSDVLFAGEEAYVDEATELAHALIQRATDLAGTELTRNDDEDGEDGECAYKSMATDLARANIELANAIAVACKPSPSMLALANGIIDRARRVLPADECERAGKSVKELLGEDAPDA